MFKKRSSAASSSAKESGAASASISITERVILQRHDDDDSSSDDQSHDDLSSLRSKTKRAKVADTSISTQQQPSSTSTATKENPSMLMSSIAASKSLAADRISISDQHTHFKPKEHSSKTERETPTLSVPSKMPAKSDRFAPIKVSGYARNISRFDYQPDLCKDFFETGYCGYGDSCKFVHDRSETKPSWQLDMEFEAEQKEKRAKERQIESAPSSANNCTICLLPYRSPVQLRCTHVFCEECFLRVFAQQSRLLCPVCNLDSHGAFTKIDNEKAVKSKPSRDEDEDDGG